MPGSAKRAKLEAPPPDPYTAYVKALNQAKAKVSLSWPWQAKPGVPPFPGLPGCSYPPQPAAEFRRPEEVREPREERYGDSPQPKAAAKEPEEKFVQPALAEEISTVAEALSGAPKHATETVLKILERLTQRLDKAERDRDVAFGKYKELQTRYVQLEEELAKKRGELRELLRQDCRPSSPATAEEPSLHTNGGGEKVEVAGGEPEVERGGANLTVIVARLGEAREEGARKSNQPSTPNSLPKVRTLNTRDNLAQDGQNLRPWLDSLILAHTDHKICLSFSLLDDRKRVR